MPQAPHDRDRSLDVFKLNVYRYMATPCQARRNPRQGLYPAAGCRVQLRQGVRRSGSIANRSLSWPNHLTLALVSSSVEGRQWGLYWCFLTMLHSPMPCVYTFKIPFHCRHVQYLWLLDPPPTMELLLDPLERPPWTAMNGKKWAFKCKTETKYETGTILNPILPHCVFSHK